MNESRVIVMTPQELRAIVREEVRAAVEHLEQRTSNAPAEWLDTESAAELLRVHPDTLRRMRDVPCYRVGTRSRRYRRDELVAYMKRSA